VFHGNAILIFRLTQEIAAGFQLGVVQKKENILRSIQQNDSGISKFCTRDKENSKYRTNQKI
jgi:hypothetical protein